MRSDYDRQWSRLERRPSDLIFQADSLHIPPLQVHTIFSQDDECVPQRTPSLVTKFSDVLLQVAKEGYLQILMELIDLLNYVFFEIIVFKRYLKSLADGKDTYSRRTSKVVKANRFRRVLVSSGKAKKDCHDTQFVNILPGLLPMQHLFSEKADIMFCPEQRSATSAVFSPCIATDYNSIWYQEV